MANRFHLILEKHFSSPSQDSDTKRKIIILASCLLGMTPAIYIISFVSFRAGNMREFWPAFLLASCMLILLLMMKSLRDIELPFRMVAFLSLATLAYLLAIGAGNGQVFVWFYCYPMVVFYVSGQREGLFWVSISLALSAWIFLFNPAREIYGFVTALRFLMTYTIVAAIAYGLESSRTHYYQELLEEKNALEVAIQQIKTLRGLLPICSSCKSIRDDQGYWNRIESYLNSHSEARLSHGICPTCMKKLYPTEYEELAQAGELPDQAAPDI